MAKADFEHVLKIDPRNKEAQQQLHLVNKKIKQHAAKEKSIYGEIITLHFDWFLELYFWIITFTQTPPWKLP